VSNNVSNSNTRPKHHLARLKQFNAIGL